MTERIPVASKAAHQLVVQGNVEPGFPGVTLASGASAQLVVDAPGLVALRAEDEQPAMLHDEVVVLLPMLLVYVEGLGIPAQNDVRAPACHVRRDGHGAGPAGLGHDLRLPLVLLGV